MHLLNVHSSVFFSSRWVKFEEDVEEGGNRWSKPHVATLSLHSLFELRSMLLNGTVCLDMTAHNLDDITELVLDNMINTDQITYDKKAIVKDAILKKHRHQVREGRGRSATTRWGGQKKSHSLCFLPLPHSGKGGGEGGWWWLDRFAISLEPD